MKSPLFAWRSMSLLSQPGGSIEVRNQTNRVVLGSFLLPIEQHERALARENTVLRLAGALRSSEETISIIAPIYQSNSILKCIRESVVPRLLRLIGLGLRSNHSEGSVLKYAAIKCGNFQLVYEPGKSCGIFSSYETERFGSSGIRSIFLPLCSPYIGEYSKEFDGAVNLKATPKTRDFVAATALIHKSLSDISMLSKGA